ncbi:hypothetical protein KC906_03935 [Candidatus Kaiserbacteria bacterium]|nr:hypothetical protein [Candidatus Kaiserbacteria bacterium]MCB9812375.1 hypothetical protein [Candidatus Nomurabacteria bacterium]
MMYAPSVSMDSANMVGGFGADGDDMMMKEMESSYYPMPIPTPDSYTAGLETYETTSYAVTAKTKDFDDVCDSLTALKAQTDIHFKSLNASTNNCYATFYAEEAAVEEVLATFTQYRNIEVSRDTSSVTRHKQRLEGQTSIMQQQLARTEKSLAAAEAQLERLNALFTSSNEVTKLSAEVTNSLRYIDQLTQRKISYISQLNNLYQQAADLEERINVVQFDVSISRANPISVGKYDRQWDNAWEELKEQYTETLIGLTAMLGIFLLWLVRLVVYALIVIVIVRGLWKFVQVLWSRW